MRKRVRSSRGAVRRGSERRRVRDGLVGAALGAAATYFSDPDNGRRRRSVARDRGLALLRRTGSRAEQAGRGVAAETYGVSQKVQHIKEEPKDFDDVTLARKVETEIFRDPEVPKGQINVNAANGVVSLRGEVQRAEMIDELVERARNVQGVRDVENLLHLPDAPAHTRP
jgi:osmotically-inducible protein OsmY